MLYHRATALPYMKRSVIDNYFINAALQLFMTVLAQHVQIGHILSKNSSAQMGFRVNLVLARNSCIQCYISLFTEIILQQLGAFKIEIQVTLTKL